MPATLHPYFVYSMAERGGYCWSCATFSATVLPALMVDEHDELVGVVRMRACDNCGHETQIR